MAAARAAHGQGAEPAAADQTVGGPADAAAMAMAEAEVESAVEGAGASAQMRARIRRPRQGERPFRISAYAHVGRLSQTANDSFTATLGSASGSAFGGGVEVTLRNGIFGRGELSRFAAEGERVELEEGEVVPLGIPLTVSLTPIEFTGGYRFRPWQPGGGGGQGRQGGLRLVPYVGAGGGVLRYRERSGGDVPEEAFDGSFGSYHVLIGLEVPFGRRVATGVELQRRWVPDALGGGGVSEALGETDLGGITVRIRLRFGF